MRSNSPKRKRCAVYTRKSSEEGLDQDFNSLDAQREACLAYIQSQKSEGWRAVRTHYDDGGYSGGNLDRPALIKLLADIEAGKIDTVVVYKVDRLTLPLPICAFLTTSALPGRKRPLLDHPIHGRQSDQYLLRPCGSRKVASRRIDASAGAH